MQLVLASTSVYRKNLLSRLGLNFQCVAPSVDETPRTGEPAEQLAQRLAREKAQAVAQSHPNALIIGSDQVAVCQHKILGKPGSRQAAQRQLSAASGKTMTLHTGLCLYNSATDNIQLRVEAYQIKFRTLSAQQISYYVAQDQPLDCAGSFKWECLGIALFESMQGNDVTALEGLPLISLTAMLAQEGIDVLAPTTTI